MGSPPTVKGSDDFDFEIPDIDETAKVEEYAQRVRDEIMALRATVLVNGSLANDLMELHRAINNTAEIDAQFAAYAHPRHHIAGQDATCRFRDVSRCLRFTVIKLIRVFQYFKENSVRCEEVDTQLARVKAIGCNGLNNFKVAGSERDGYYLKLKKDVGLTR